MAKRNKYWGLVAVGALTAAAAGAVASVVLKKARRGYAAFEDDFEDDYFEDDFSVPENTETSEAYAQWEEPENTETEADENTDSAPEKADEEAADAAKEEPSEKEEPAEE